MARPPADDPLIPLPVRLPTSAVERLRATASARGCSVSDVLRSHLTLDAAKPLGKPRPRQREQKLSVVSGADPVLLRAVAGIGNNMNQLARTVNAGLVGGTPVECVQILMSLRSIEEQISTLQR